MKQVSNLWYHFIRIIIIAIINGISLYLLLFIHISFIILYNKFYLKIEDNFFSSFMDFIASIVIFVSLFSLFAAPFILFGYCIFYGFSHFFNNIVKSAFATFAVYFILSMTFLAVFSISQQIQQYLFWGADKLFAVGNILLFCKAKMLDLKRLS